MAGTSPFRKLILNLHLWVGLGAAILLLLTGASGALLVFEDQIDHALNPHLSHVVVTGKPLTLTALQETLERQYPGGRVLGFGLPDRDDLSYEAYVQPVSGDGIPVALDQYNGRVLGVWNDNRFVRKLHGFHTHLLAGEIGSEIVGWGSVFVLFLSVTGLILWWRSKITYVNFQTSGPKFQYDLHSTTGILSSLFLLAFALTGIVVHWERPAQKWANSISHVSRPPQPKPDIPKAGATPLDPDHLLAAAQAAVPGARATVINFADDSTHPALVIFRFPEDHTPAGRTRVFLDAYTGKVLSLASSREAPMTVAYVTRLNREIHTGDIGGWPTRLLAAISSICLPLLAITGPLLWWQRRQRRA
jgi:uncharacterized iron-regulated membrane protein